ncbi:MAG TPA: tetratricopeptide repeat protein [Jiangellales bacterium]|nr:tetratricopeptide repeat protein [Jiangellales bacterium]
MTARRTTLLLLVVLGVYLVLVGWRGVLLVRTGDAVGVGLGLAVLVLPAVAAVVVAREVRFGLATQRMARELEAAGALPVDDLPRRPSGRVVREAADHAFAGRRAEVEAAPGDWRAWYRLALAYDDAGDRRRAREAMRHAARLHVAGPS